MDCRRSIWSSFPYFSQYNPDALPTQTSDDCIALTKTEGGLWSRRSPSELPVQAAPVSRCLTANGVTSNLHRKMLEYNVTPV
ncbi:hypothetical protein AFLA_003305 [Aspergillus flavus NRRL3357]|nr:hypothetical protein AFLA_003305 [Aspergillus flavus NRRL3357]